MVEIAVNRDMAISAGNYVWDTWFPTLMEDPNLNNNRIFIVSQAYDVDKLSVIYGKKWSYLSDTTFVGADFSRSNNLNTSYGLNGTGYNFLYNGSVNCFAPVEAAAANSTAFNKHGGFTYHLTLDPQNNLPRTALKLNSNNILYVYPNASSWRNAAANTCVYFVYNTSGDITQQYCLVSGIQDNASFTANRFGNIILYEDVYNEALWTISTLGGTDGTNFGQQRVGFLKNYLDAGNPASYTDILTSSGVDNYFMGLDNYNNPYIARLNRTANNDPVSITYINNLSKAATDILAAQLPASSMAISWLNCQPSNIRTANTSRKVFYTMHYDVNNTLLPVRYVWNNANVADVTKTDCTITYPGSNTFFSYATRPVLPTLTANTFPLSPQYGKPYQFTVGSNNYLTFTWCDAGVMNASSFYTSRFTGQAQRTWITYQIGSGTNDNQLTYHSSIQFPTYADMPRAWIPTTYGGSTLAVAVPLGVKFYTFNETNGWIQTGFYPTSGPVLSMGLDQTNRLWGIVGDKGAGSVHVITPNQPVTISIVMANTSYTYTGTNINTTGALNAYDINGSRISANVVVTIDGSTMTFDDASKSKTFTTNASADTTCNFIITGGGINNLTTSINI